MSDASATTYDEYPKIWSSNTKFFLALMSWTIGLTNYQKTPNLLVTHGFLDFIILYALFTVIIGIPLVYIELGLSQFSSKSLRKCFDYCPILRGISCSKLIILIIFQSYYNVTNNYSLFYAYNSFSKQMQWETCGKYGTDKPCYNLTSPENYNSTDKHQDSVDQYWLFNVLQTHRIDNQIEWPFLGPAICTGVNALILFAASKQGPRRLGSFILFLLVVYVTELLVLLAITSTAKGGMKCLKYLIFSEINMENYLPWKYNSLSLEIFKDLFVSLGLGLGGFSVFGSQCRFRKPVYVYAILVNVLNLIVTLLHTIIIFNFYGILSESSDTPIYNLIQNDTNLFLDPLFTVIPRASHLLPGIPQIWVFLFYTHIYVLGLMCSVTMLYVTLQALYEFLASTNHHNEFVPFIVTIMISGFNVVLQTNLGILVKVYIQELIYNTLLPVINCLYIYSVVVFYGVLRFIDDMHFMLGFRPSCYWQVCWILSPALLTTLTIFSTLQFYKNPNGIYNYLIQFEFINITQKCVLIISLSVIGVAAMLSIIKKEYNWRNLMQPSEKWGPKSFLGKKSRIMFLNDLSTEEYVYQQNLLILRQNKYEEM